MKTLTEFIFPTGRNRVIWSTLAFYTIWFCIWFGVTAAWLTR